MTLARGVPMAMILFLATAHAAENDLDVEAGTAYVLPSWIAPECGRSGS